MNPSPSSPESSTSSTSSAALLHHNDLASLVEISKTMVAELDPDKLRPCLAGRD